jgi:hypothetical protein
MTDVLETYDYGETIPVRHEPGDNPNRELVNNAVETVADANGNLVIAMKNVGATPWFRPTPYPNNDGVMVRMWMCISSYPKAVPGNVLLFGRRTPVWPDEEDGYNVRMFTKPWMKANLAKGTHFEIHKADDSPYKTDWYDWNWENRGGYPRE